MSAEPAAAVPAGAERRGSSLVVTVSNPSFELLKAVTKHNKGSTSKSELDQQWSIKRSSNTAAVPVAEFWAALYEAGGIHLVGVPAAVRHVHRLTDHACAGTCCAWHERLADWLPPEASSCS